MTICVESYYSPFLVIIMIVTFGVNAQRPLFYEVIIGTICVSAGCQFRETRNDRQWKITNTEVR